MEFDIEKCPRCGEKHEKVKFKPMTNSVGAVNCHAVCPKTKDPVLGTLTLSLPDDKPGGPPTP